MIYISGVKPNEITDPDNASIEDIVAAYNKHLPMLASVKFITPARVARIKAIKKISPTFKTIEFWNDFFQEIAKDEWLTGAQPNSKWKATLDYLISNKGFITTVERLA